LFHATQPASRRHQGLTLLFEVAVIDDPFLIGLLAGHIDTVI
jgi:hypothetical protein